MTKVETAIFYTFIGLSVVALLLVAYEAIFGKAFS